MSPASGPASPRRERRAGRRLARAAPSLLLAVATGCMDAGERDLGHRRIALEREVTGLRELAGQLERGEPVVAPDDVAIVVDDVLLRQLVAARLPLEADIEGFQVRLTQAEVSCHGRAIVELRGDVRLREQPSLESRLSAHGVIEDFAIDAESGMLRAGIGLDEIVIERAAGVEAWLSTSALPEIAWQIRTALPALLPPLEIPVSFQQRLSLPAVTTGPVRIRGATMPVRASVSRVAAGRGQLWIGVRVEPGRFAPSVLAAPPDSPPVAAEEGG